MKMNGLEQRGSPSCNSIKSSGTEHDLLSEPECLAHHTKASGTVFDAMIDEDIHPEAAESRTSSSKLLKQ